MTKKRCAVIVALYVAVILSMTTAGWAAMLHAPLLLFLAGGFGLLLLAVLARQVDIWCSSGAGSTVKGDS